MTKKIFIFTGILLILIIGGVWLYAFLHPNAGGAGIFARFGAGGDAPPVQESATNDIEGDDEEDIVQDASTTQHLRQITTNPVAGATFARDGILYVEQGTGHLQYINLVSGEETLLSGTTIPGAYEASFSKDGETVAITTRENDVAKTIVATVPTASTTGTLNGISLPRGASEVDVSQKDGVAYYLMKSSEGSVGYAYNISKKTSTELFSIPLRDVHVLWGDPLYVYTTPSYTQTGYVYKVSKNNLVYVAPGAVGLMATRYNTDVAVTQKISNENGSVWLSSIEGGGEIPLTGPVFPEKCVAHDATFWCGVPSVLNENFPDSWYKGVVSLSDSLWKINVSDRSTQVVSDFFKESGRQIDVLKIGMDSPGTHLYLVNKNDNTLWLYTL